MTDWFSDLNDRVSKGLLMPADAQPAMFTDAQTATDTRMILADEYENGLRKMEASGYEEWQPQIQNHRLVIEALRFQAKASSAPHLSADKATAPKGSLKERIAINLWHRFAPESHMEWEEETHQAEYVLAADDVLFLTRNEPQGARKPSAWRVCWVRFNTSRTELFEDYAKATGKARETGGCVIPLYASQPSPAATVETNSPEQDRESDCKTNPELTGHSPKDRGERVLPHLSAGNWDVECERIEKDFYAKVGRYCTFGPPAERKRQWIILFEDADKGMMIFEDEREAHTAWDRAKDNWTCTLYETAHRKFVFAAGQLRPLVEPQAVPETQSAAALTERLIQAAVDYESGRCSKREMAEARAAVEEAIK